MPLFMSVETTTPIAGSATYTGVSQSASPVSYSLIPTQINFFSVRVFADQIGTARIEYSPDNVTWTRVSGDFMVRPIGSARLFVLNTPGIYYRVVVVNGATAQTAFRIESGFTNAVSPMPDECILTGPAAQSVINTNLIDGVVSGWTDVSAFNSGTFQIISSAGVSAGVVTFECTNDTTLSANGSSIITVRLADSIVVSSVTPGASSAANFSFPVGAKYVRARISTAFVGGTVQAVLALSQRTVVVPQGSAVSNIDNIWYQESITAQAALATVTGTARDILVASGSSHRYSAFNAYAFADQSGTLKIQVSNDNSTWRDATVATTVAANMPVYLSVPVTARYHRAVFVNGAVLQAAFLLNTSYTAA